MSDKYKELNKRCNEMKKKYEARREEYREEAKSKGYDQALIDRFVAELAEKKALINKGEWSTEPDRLEFEHAGFSCIIQRNNSLAWCGYVGLPPEHKYYGKNYQDLEKLDVELDGAHGGLTYSEPCMDLICHKSDDDTKPLWWLGFDCAHAYDLIPGFYEFISAPSLPGTYRNMDYVIARVKTMAEELAA